MKITVNSAKCFQIYGTLISLRLLCCSPLHRWALREWTSQLHWVPPKPPSSPGQSQSPGSCRRRGWSLRSGNSHSVPWWPAGGWCHSQENWRRSPIRSIAWSINIFLYTNTLYVAECNRLKCNRRGWIWGLLFLDLFQHCRDGFWAARQYIIARMWTVFADSSKLSHAGRTIHITCIIDRVHNVHHASSSSKTANATPLHLAWNKLALSATTFSVRPPETILARTFSLLWACLASLALPCPNLAI